MKRRPTLALFLRAPGARRCSLFTSCPRSFNECADGARRPLRYGASPAQARVYPPSGRCHGLDKRRPRHLPAGAVVVGSSGRAAFWFSLGVFRVAFWLLCLWLCRLLWRRRWRGVVCVGCRRFVGVGRFWRRSGAGFVVFGIGRWRVAIMRRLWACVVPVVAFVVVPVVARRALRGLWAWRARLQWWPRGASGRAGLRRRGLRVWRSGQRCGSAAPLARALRAPLSWRFSLVVRRK